jgi:hypothetical protein
MRIFIYTFFALLLFMVLEKVFSLLIKGKLFEEGALKKSLQESRKTLWQGMQLFVVVWLLYLILNWLVRSRH